MDKSKQPYKPGKHFHAYLDAILQPVVHSYAVELCARANKTAEELQYGPNCFKVLAEHTGNHSTAGIRSPGGPRYIREYVLPNDYPTGNGVHAELSDAVLTKEALNMALSPVGLNSHAKVEISAMHIRQRIKREKENEKRRRG